MAQLLLLVYVGQIYKEILALIFVLIKKSVLIVLFLIPLITLVEVIGMFVKLISKIV
jgi:hypothetical protein